MHLGTNCKFIEPQGRLVLVVDCYLNIDLDNEELDELIKNIDVNVEISGDKNLISDIDVTALTG